MTKSISLLVFCAFACFLTACKTKPAYDREVQLQIDIDSIARFIKINNITATKTAEGLFYNVINPGTGSTIINLNDTVMVHYVGRALNGRLLDSTSNNIDSTATRFVLGSSIEGWQRGIPLIQPGGRIRLIVPSVMAYQNRNLVATDSLLLPNTNLDFDIRLIKVLKKK